VSKKQEVFSMFGKIVKKLSKMVTNEEKVKTMLPWIDSDDGYLISLWGHLCDKI